jgi:hypothetical protein
MTEPIMENNKAEETRLDINVGVPSPEFFEREYREFMEEYKCRVKFVYKEHALKKLLKADLIKDLIKLNQRNHMLRLELLHPKYVDYISQIENLEAIIENGKNTRVIIERKLINVEDKNRLLLLRVAELEEQLEKCNVRRCEL